MAANFRPWFPVKVSCLPNVGAAWESEILATQPVINWCRWLASISIRWAVVADVDMDNINYEDYENYVLIQIEAHNENVGLSWKTSFEENEERGMWNENRMREREWDRGLEEESWIERRNEEEEPTPFTYSTEEAMRGGIYNLHPVSYPCILQPSRASYSTFASRHMYASKLISYPKKHKEEKKKKRKNWAEEDLIKRYLRTLLEDQIL